MLDAIYFIRVDKESEKTHIVLFKSPKDVLQLNTMSQQLGLGSQLNDWYTKATSIPYGYLLIDLPPKTVDPLQFWTNSRLIPSIVPSTTEIADHIFE